MDQIAQLRGALSGRYEIVREIGAGGMATVYLARDTKHDRSVALKVLKPELGAVLGVERFLSEIRVTANLQHPNLLPLFDSGEANGLLFYVMPFVEGETLRARLEREQQLPIDEAVRIAASIASALGYAHAHGVIHRDLKPENVLLQSGQPLIADFGIALAVSNAGGARVTQTGISLGTPQYMSPEQAAGDRAIDARSDIYSLGAMTYEMLAGTPPHAGGSAQAVIAKLMTADPPPLVGLRSTTPLGIARAVEKALSRVPADRFTSAEKFGDALQLGATTGIQSASIPNSRDVNRAWLRHPASLALMLVMFGLAGAVAWTKAHAPAAPAFLGTVRFNLTLPKGAKLSTTATGPMADISPDGRSIVYVGESDKGRQLWIRDLDQLQPRPLVGTDNALVPQFSPDGKFIFFVEGLTFMEKVIPRTGGAVSSLFSNVGAAPLTFTNDDSLIFGGIAPNVTLLRTSVNGGKPIPVFSDAERTKYTSLRSPLLAPDDNTLFFTAGIVGGGAASGAEIGVTTLKERRTELTGIDGRRALAYLDGRLVYAQTSGEVMAVPFDLKSRRPTGPAVSALGETVMIDLFGSRASLTSTGHLAMIAGTLRRVPYLLRDNGPPTRVGNEERDFQFPRFSPDGKAISFTIADGGRSDIWIYHVAQGNFERLTTEGTVNDRQEWWPDGLSLVFRSNRDGQYAYYRQPADNSSPAVRITPPMSLPVQEMVIGPDGVNALLRVDTQQSARDILKLKIGDSKPEPYLATPFDELTPRFSPSGKWVAYTSNESGRDEIYVRAFPGPGGRTIVSDGGGNEPLWSRDGNTLYYRTGVSIIRTTVSQSPSFQVIRRDTLLQGNYTQSRLHPMYAVDPSGRILALQQTDGDLTLTVVLNWGQALRDRLGPAK